MDTSRESGWNKEAAAACNDTGGLARHRPRTYEKAERKGNAFSEERAMPCELICGYSSLGTFGRNIGNIGIIDHISAECEFK
jgi:hypothetical protein